MHSKLIVFIWIRVESSSGLFWTQQYL